MELVLLSLNHHRYCAPGAGPGVTDPSNVTVLPFVVYVNDAWHCALPANGNRSKAKIAMKRVIMFLAVINFNDTKMCSSRADFKGCLTFSYAFKFQAIDHETYNTG